jgi:hypothetical protein
MELFLIFYLILSRCDLKRCLDEKSLFHSKGESFRICPVAHYRAAVYAYRTANACFT